MSETIFQNKTGDVCVYMIQKHQSTDLSQGRMIVTTARCVQLPAWLNLQAKYCPYCGHEIVYRKEEEDVKACKERIIEHIHEQKRNAEDLLLEHSELEYLEEMLNEHTDLGNKNTQLEQKIEYLDQQVARLVKEKQELENKLEEVFEGHEDSEILTSCGTCAYEDILLGDEPCYSCSVRDAWKAKEEQNNV